MSLEDDYGMAEPGECDICHCTQCSLVSYGSARICKICEEEDRKAEWDAFEETKRRRIEERNEY